MESTAGKEGKIWIARVKSGEGESNPGSEKQIRTGRIKYVQIVISEYKEANSGKNIKIWKGEIHPAGGFKIGQGESNPSRYNEISEERLKSGQEEYTSSKWSQLRVKRVKYGKARVKSGEGESIPRSEKQIRAGRIKYGQIVISEYKE